MRPLRLDRTRIAVVAFFLACLAGTTHAAPQPPRPLAPGDLFPRLQADALNGQPTTLPDAGKGRYTLLLFGFTYDSRHAVEPWTESIQQAFGQRDDVVWFQVPVIGGMGRMAKWFINSGMRKGTPPALHGRVLTVYGDAGRWKAIAGFADAAKDAAYLIVLDGQGRVVWLHHGPCEPSTMAELTRLLERNPGIRP